MKVLLVDDDRDLLRTAAEYFERRGIEVLKSEAPLGVTPTLREHRPDAVVLDVMMPTLNGATLAGHLKHLRAMQAVPILFYSAMDEEKLRALAREVDVAYVSKSDGLPALHRALLLAVERQ